MNVSMYFTVSSICAYTISMMITSIGNSMMDSRSSSKPRLRLKLRDNCLLSFFLFSLCFYSSRSSALHLTDMSWERIRIESIGIFRHGPLNFQGFFAFSYCKLSQLRYLLMCWLYCNQAQTHPYRLRKTLRIDRDGV